MALSWCTAWLGTYPLCERTKSSQQMSGADAHVWRWGACPNKTSGDLEIVSRGRQVGCSRMAVHWHDSHVFYALPGRQRANLHLKDYLDALAFTADISGVRVLPSVAVLARSHMNQFRLASKYYGPGTPPGLSGAPTNIPHETIMIRLRSGVFILDAKVGH